MFSALDNGYLTHLILFEAGLIALVFASPNLSLARESETS